MPKRDGKQQGQQHHAEGAHGDKTHQHILQQLHSKSSAPSDPAEGASNTDHVPKHRDNPVKRETS